MIVGDEQSEKEDRGANRVARRKVWSAFTVK
jgi:hypothetical protein